MSMSVRKARGFTLIELLVVVSIIVLLVSLLLPSMKKAKDYAALAACKSNQKQLFMLLDFYSKDYNDQIPLGFAEDRSGRLWITDSFYVYQGREQQYIIWGRLYKGDYLKDGKVLAEPGGRFAGNPGWGYDRI